LSPSFALPVSLSSSQPEISSSCYNLQWPKVLVNPRARGKGKEWQSLRTSISKSLKNSKARASLHRKCKPSTVESIQVDSDSEHEEPQDSTSVAVSQVDSGPGTADEGSDSSSDLPSTMSSSSKRIPLMTGRLAGSRASTSTQSPVVSSTISSTIMKWMSKKATASNDQDTWHLFGQLATAVPLRGSSHFDKARKEVVQGLRKVPLPGSSKSSNAKTPKENGKVCKACS